MRTTLVLLKHNVKRRFDIAWKAQGRRRVIDYEVAENLIDKFGIQVPDGIDVAQPKLLREKFNIAWPYKKPIPIDESHADWKSRICHHFTEKTRILEGENQALILTKTAKINYLPQEITRHFSEEISNQDEEIKQLLCKTMAWDGVQIKLPRIFDRTKRHWRFPRVYGIPAERHLYHLYKHLLAFCDSNVFDVSSVKSRTILKDARVNVPVEKDGDLLFYNFGAAYLMSSNSLLKPFADHKEIENMANSALPDIYPVKCTIDLRKTNFYNLQDFFPFSPEAIHPFVHTLFLQYSGNPALMSKDTLTARAIAGCYAFTMAQNVMLRDKEDLGGILQHPIPIQCVATDGKQFQFMAFQLNTTNVNGTDGIKNIAWIDNWINLYESFNEVNYEVVMEGYNPDVFKRFLAFYRNTNQQIPVTSKVSQENL